MAGPGFRAPSTYHLEDVDGRTRLLAETDNEYFGRVARLTARLSLRHGQRKLERDLARLRRILESEDPESSRFRLGNRSRSRLWLNRAIILLVGGVAGAVAGFVVGSGPFAA